MKILLTGGSGYLGSAIIRNAPREWNITATYLTQPLNTPRTLSASLDIRDANSVDRVFDDLRPVVVIHTAACSTGQDMHGSNAVGSRHIASAAAKSGSRLVHLSSDVIFDGEHAPYSEKDAPSPKSPYAASKALAEKAVLDEHPNPLIIRTSLIYGFSPIDPRTRQTLDGGMPLLYTDEFRSPVFVDDLANAIIELVPTETNGWLNVAGSQRLSRYEFGIKLAAALKVQPRFAPALCASNPTPRPRDCTLDITRATNLLRTHLRGVDEVLATVVLPNPPL